MHPKIGTKRGCFPTDPDDSEHLSDESTISNFTSAKQYQILASHVRLQNFRKKLTCPESWAQLPEIPTSEEILCSDINPEDWDDYQHDIPYDTNLPCNIVEGIWSSKIEYVSTHYKILRENAIGPLRHAVQTFRRDPGMMEDKLMYIYSEVTIIGWKLCNPGPACRVQFCNNRSEKQIRWQQSKRLLQGSLVALSSSKDLFQKKCKLAVVVGRSTSGGLDQNPPSIELFFGDNDDVELDPHEGYVMIEACTGYFEASRYLLVALQDLMSEKSPLDQYLTEFDKSVKAPEYLDNQPVMNFSCLLDSDRDLPQKKDNQTLTSKSLDFDVISKFPWELDFGLDKSQMKAMHTIITKCLAVVQGPPGTGKTHVSVSSLKLLSGNLGPRDPPIIIAAQTNHALDQLLNHILKFEDNILRLGGRSARINTIIRTRTLFELRNSISGEGKKHGINHGINHMREMKALQNKLTNILEPLLTDKLLTSEQLLTQNIITEKQASSLSTLDWAENETVDGVVTWLGNDQIIPIRKTPLINEDLPLEDDLNDNIFKDSNIDKVLNFDEPTEIEDNILFGKFLPYRRKYTGNHSGPIDSKKWRRRMNKIKDLYEIHESERGMAYRYFELEFDAKMRKTVRSILGEYKEITKKIKIAKSLESLKLIKKLGIKIIGCTTTGLSKYRALLSALQPRILLIEEAAETLEGKVLAGIPEGIEQLILVGDHQQLQASCTVRRLQEAPYNMKISMFERLITNNFPYTMLNRQRRMIYDVRKLLCIEPTPFYSNLEDDKIVFDRVKARPPVPGMGGNDTYFFHHTWPEAQNSDKSCYNNEEAEMVVGFFQYLFLNGLDVSNITILSYYNGQRKLILNLLRRIPSLLDIEHFNVFTVDSYQGEENDVIILSLVRSNVKHSIGFLSEKNRMVVALSRAKRGLYIFGNAITLTTNEWDDIDICRKPLWLPVIKYLGSQNRFDMDKGLPVICDRHKVTTMIGKASDFSKLAGGCSLKCDRGPLPCHHSCPLTCHPFEHDTFLKCQEPCSTTLDCGHECSGVCSGVCFCDQCNPKDDGLQIIGNTDLPENIASDSANKITDVRGETILNISHNLVGLQGSDRACFEIIKPGDSDLPGKKIIKSSKDSHDAWANWRPKKDESSPQIKGPQGQVPGFNATSTLIEDIHKPISIQDGVRKVKPVSRRVIEIPDVNDPSLPRGFLSTRDIDTESQGCQSIEDSNEILENLLTNFDCYENIYDDTLTTSNDALDVLESEFSILDLE
ncbi:DEAD box helicase involved in nonsense mediated decay [Blumeria hordei DH14]|uniref:DEAD box helicase involved in nonsense mediated decay n=1 Tax=Blumeria graminis f. sp. hordei (strain DH14) TaxID=546991 RepID=N1JQ76_BLUG1|nr:DEAD box helicase involved in nonsense mediated decay [Blumeria hordei DH14]